MAEAETKTEAKAPVLKRRRRPSPRLDQFRRTWYFFRRNTLAMIGLGILVCFVILFIAQFWYPANSTNLTQYEATNGVLPTPNSPVPQVCTYMPGNGESAPGPNCYATPNGMPSVIAPTFSLHPATLGPLPFGSLTLNPGADPFYNTFDGLVKGTQWSLTISLGVATFANCVCISERTNSNCTGRTLFQALV